MHQNNVEFYQTRAPDGPEIFQSHRRLAIWAFQNLGVGKPFYRNYSVPIFPVLNRFNCIFCSNLMPDVFQCDQIRVWDTISIIIKNKVYELFSYNARRCKINVEPFVV